ncbi:MAG: aspartate--tRNA(Asn) ligase, partial [Nanoarchaeota archaeon]|nr:aspartate--tRNA(Asn) ligase [Nanoarchaeota archaeon]
MFYETEDIVVLKGWVSAVRDLNKIIFLIVREDGRYYQATLTEENEPNFSIARSLKPEDVIVLRGKIKLNSDVINNFEITPLEIKILAHAEQPIPLNMNEKIDSTLDKQLDYRFLSLRKEKQHAIFKIESTVTYFINDFFQKKGFVNFHSSKIVSQATEGGANVFPIVYFDKTAYLAQSPQFYKQMMVIAGYPKVFEIGPVFRAEPHHTTRHLCEYTSVDIEMGFIESYEEIMKIMEELMVKLLKFVHKKNKTELDILGARAELQHYKFPRIPFKEAKKILKEKYSKEIGDDIDPEGERMLGEYVKNKYKSDFFFLTEFPWSAAQFYHMRKAGEEDVTYRADLIYKGLEITTLAQREHRYDVLLSQLKEKGLDPEKFSFYLDFFKYGAPPHGGGGTGLERIVKQMLDLQNIAEATLLPRTPE